MKEIWKPIVGFDHYEVSDIGRIRSLGFDYMGNNNIRCVAYPKVLKHHFNKRLGYNHIILRKNKKPHTFKIHRLVALAFHDNPNNYSDVNHKNGIKTDNRVENLEWCTKSQNHKHRFSVLGHIPNDIRRFNVIHSKRIHQFNLKGKFIKEFKSIRDASIETGIMRSGISFVAQGKGKTAGGFVWSFPNDSTTANN